jgi:hypothetical protein
MNEYAKQYVARLRDDRGETEESGRARLTDVYHTTI